MDRLAECRPDVQVLLARVLRRAKDDPDVEDCTNETMRRALEGSTSLRPDEPMRPWVLGIARHVGLDALRVEYRRRARIAPEDPSSDREPSVERVADRSAGPEAIAADRQRARRLEAALGVLPERQREALLLFSVEGLGYREIAERLEVSIGTVGTWILRAKERLAVELGDSIGSLGGSGGSR